MKSEFFMLMDPPTMTHQEKKIRVVNNKPVVYEPQELKATRAKLMAHLAHHKPPDQHTGPLRLMVKWCFLAGDNHVNGSYRTTKPDTDNLQKMLKDCMTACGFWKDDCLVVSEIIEKFWADVPGIYIQIEELEDRT